MASPLVPMPPSTLPFSAMTDAQVQDALRTHRIGLTVEEARKVEQMLGRAPTITEATIWGIQGSEHCSYKSSRRFLKQFVTESRHVILGPKEDSGIVAITDGPAGQRWGIVVSHESHNHPSQLVPYEGAATGVGGCVRDVVCMGARVIGSLDSLRLGDLKTDESASIAKEVVRGVAGYGNALGIPNLGGDTVFDAGYNKNCLVNVVAVGLIREDEIIHSYVAQEAGSVGYDIIIVGKATDRSGFGGASFASVAIQEDEAEQNTGAVQEPNPFLERHLLASTYALFDKLASQQKLDKVSFKDLGAGGNVCASVEQVAPLGLGAVVDLDKIHVALAGLPPEVIACAETQERFCWICHPDLTQEILDHYNVTWDLPSVAERARASVVGRVTDTDTYTLLHHGETVCSARSTDITSGLQYVRPTRASPTSFPEPDVSCTGSTIAVAGTALDLADIFRAMVSHPSHASKAPVFRSYDKNIIGNTLIEAGEADASVITPLADLQSYVTEGGHPGWTMTDADRMTGVAFASGGNGRYGRISPYLQGVHAVLENMRNVAAVGALPRALTDCLNYGNPEIPEQLWALEEGVRGIADAAKGIDIDGEPVPVISGNVSLYNATARGSIDPTAIVCCIGVMSDARKAVGMQLTAAGSLLYLIGPRKDECGGSAYHHMLELLTHSPTDALIGNRVPQPDFAQAKAEILAMNRAIHLGLVLACHDISEGGLMLALFEMTLPQRRLGGTLGLSIDLTSLSPALRTDTLLFCETGGFVVAVDPRCRAAFETQMADSSCDATLLGAATQVADIVVMRDGGTILDLPVASLRDAWQTGLSQAWA